MLQKSQQKLQKSVKNCASLEKNCIHSINMFLWGVTFFKCNSIATRLLLIIQKWTVADDNLSGQNIIWRGVGGFVFFVRYLHSGREEKTANPPWLHWVTKWEKQLIELCQGVIKIDHLPKCRWSPNCQRHHSASSALLIIKWKIGSLPPLLVATYSLIIVGSFDTIE